MMRSFKGSCVSWAAVDGVVEVELHREPCNEIGTTTLEELEGLVEALDSLSSSAHALLLHSTLKAGFCAGADLRELYAGMQLASTDERLAGVRQFLQRIHRVLNAIDSWPASSRVLRTVLKIPSTPFPPHTLPAVHRSSSER